MGEAYETNVKVRQTQSGLQFTPLSDKNAPIGLSFDPTCVLNPTICYRSCLKKWRTGQKNRRFTNDSEVRKERRPVLGSKGKRFNKLSENCTLLVRPHMFVGWASFWKTCLLPCMWEKVFFLSFTPVLPALGVAMVTTDLHIYWIQAGFRVRLRCDPLKYVAIKASRVRLPLDPLRRRIFPGQIHTSKMTNTSTAAF